MKASTSWIDWVVGSVCALLVLAAITALYPGWPKITEGLSKDAAPAWVQAVGSIVAIVAAAAIATWQAAHARQAELAREQQRIIEKYFALTSIPIATSALVETIRHSVENNELNAEVWERMGADVGRVRDMLSGFPLFEVPSVEAINQLRLLDMILASMADICRGKFGLERPNLDPKVRYAAMDRWGKRAHDSLELFQRHIARACTPEQKARYVEEGWL